MCVLRFVSESRSFKGMDVLEGLSACRLYEKGEIRRTKTGEVWQGNGLHLDVSNAEWDDLRLQTQDAIDFLKVHHAALSELLQSDVDASLDFPVWSRISDEIVNQNASLPRELITLAGGLGIGIDISIYRRDDL